MKDSSYILFLQWALPRLNLRWRGFRRVRRQVCRRIHNRISELGLSNLNSYKEHLKKYPAEWAVLDRFCRITISRFYRDRVIFDYLFSDVLPDVFSSFLQNNSNLFRIWSAGCASGEEPYTMAIGLQYTVLPLHPGLVINIIATDIDPVMLRRANEACYPSSSLRTFPSQWISKAFEQKEDSFMLQQPFKDSVRFELLDIRKKTPEGKFQVILCRNLAFTYFDVELQRKVLRQMEKTLSIGGILITGGHEEVPIEGTGFVQWVEHMPIYQKGK